MKKEVVEILRHILNARIDNADNYSEYFAYNNARDIIECAIAGDMEALRQLDYLPTKEEEEDEDD